MKKLVAFAAMFFSTLTTAMASDYFVYSQFETGGWGSYGVTGFVGKDGADRIIYYSNAWPNGAIAHLVRVSIPAGENPNQHPSNPDATGPIALRAFTQELDFPLGVNPGHESEFYVADQGATIYLGASVGIRKYVYNQTLGTYVYACDIAPAAPIDEGFGSQSLAYDPSTDTWYAGAISWNSFPGETQRKIWKYQGSQGANGIWELAFTYTTAQEWSHHDGMELLNGNLFLADYQGDYIYEYSASGTLLKTYTHDPLQHELEGMGFGALQHFWVGSHGSTITEFGGGSIQKTINNNPPVAEAGETINLSPSQQPFTVVYGTASDEDGDAMTCRWLEGDKVLTSGNVEDGSCPLDLAKVPSLSLGKHMLILEVTDSKHAVGRDQVDVNVANNAPSCAATGGGAFELGSTVQVQGQASDLDGDNLSYQWLVDGVSTASGTVTSTAGGAPVNVPLCSLGALAVGDHNVVLVVSDGIGCTSSDPVRVTVIDSAAPVISATVDNGILWPPNHLMQNVVIHYNVADNGGILGLNATAVSNEPDEGLGDGDTANDIGPIITNPLTGEITLQLRAERSGKGAGRTYTVLVTATDLVGNSSTAIVNLLVPHDKVLKK